MGKSIIIGVNTPCPCMGCEDRTESCHADCERYKKYNIVRRTISAMEFKKRQKVNALFEPRLNPIAMSKSKRERCK